MKSVALTGYVMISVPNLLPLLNGSEIG